MATEKIPSPEEIKNEPQKFTQEELDSLKGFQTRLDQILSQLGRVHLSKIKLNEQEDLIKAEIKKIETEEQELAKSLSDKYGRGSLDIETGTFTPAG
mgnify:FL=1|tara:strand:- start:976 stop:1266 length:291 start_codon:yes stop_codon:yes gene_type:complete